MPEGNFIVFSGGEGSGKTTALDRLKEEYPHLITTREPGGTEFGQRLRHMLVNEPERDAATELLLFFTDRAHHVQTVIRPALAAHETIISDRYWMDSFAYQWWGRMGIRDQNTYPNFGNLFWPFHFPTPRAWLWFDVQPEIGLARKAVATDRNRLDDLPVDFHQQVRAGFEYLFEHCLNEETSHRIDANQSPDNVYASVKAALKPYLRA